MKGWAEAREDADGGKKSQKQTDRENETKHERRGGRKDCERASRQHASGREGQDGEQ